MLRPFYRLACLLFAAILAACSTAPLRTASDDTLPYTSTEPRAPRVMPPGLPQFIDHSVGEEEISIEAMSLVGIPYRWGGNTPDSGFDCSGLVAYVVRRAAAVNLPRTTEQMESAGIAIDPAEISPGDLIFFNTTGRPHSHVGIYVGHYRFVDAPSTGGTVRIDYVTNPYWAKHFDGIRRVASSASHGRPFEAAPLEAATPSPIPQAVTAQQPDPDANAKVHTNASFDYRSIPLPETEPAMQTDTAGIAPPRAADSNSNMGTENASDPERATRARAPSATQSDPIAMFANLPSTDKATPVVTQTQPPTPAADPIASFATGGM